MESMTNSPKSLLSILSLGLMVMSPAAQSEEWAQFPSTLPELLAHGFEVKSSLQLVISDSRGVSADPAVLFLQQGTSLAMCVRQEADYRCEEITPPVRMSSLR
jgi:hypothetical protein